MSSHSNASKARLAGAILVALATAVAGFAAGPATTELPASGPGGPTGAVLPTAPQGATMYCDQMAMVGAGSYDAGNGNAIAGSGVFGGTADLQTADDCVLPEDVEISEVCQGSLSFFGVAPADGVWLQVYADTGGSPDNTAAYEVVSTDVTATPFTDTVFGLSGVVLCATIPPGFVVPAGSWFFNIQPVSVSGGDDWYYVVRDFETLTGADSHAKDGGAEHGGAFGGPYAGGFGTSTWVAFPALPEPVASGDTAFSVAGVAAGGQQIPDWIEVPTLGAAGLALLTIVLAGAAFLALRRRAA